MTTEQGSSFQTAKIGSAQWWELVESMWDFNSLNHTFISCSQISSEGIQTLKLSCPLQRPRKHTENNSRSKVNQKVPAGRNRLLLQKVSTNFTHRFSNRGLNRHVARENPSVRYQTLHQTHTHTQWDYIITLVLSVTREKQSCATQNEEKQQIQGPFPSHLQHISCKKHYLQ